MLGYVGEVSVHCDVERLMTCCDTGDAKSPKVEAPVNNFAAFVMISEVASSGYCFSEENIVARRSTNLVTSIHGRSVGGCFEASIDIMSLLQPQLVDILTHIMSNGWQQ
jgi:hypothetical protein